MREVTDIRESQMHIMPVLRYVDRICREYNLRYSLAFGTLIGAARHKGFIPWDDDVDILMPRPDMDRLLEILEEESSERFKVLSPYAYDNYFAGQMMKVYDAETELHELPHKYNLVYGSYIDIFPLDGMPDDEEEARKHHKRYDKYYEILHILAKYPFRKKDGFKKRFANLCKPFLRKYVDECREYHHLYDYESSKKGILLVQTLRFERDIYEKEWFENLIDMEFEGEMFKAFADYDECLTRFYGDYMQLPPEEQQVSHHNVKLYVKD